MRPGVLCLDHCCALHCADCASDSLLCSPGNTFLVASPPSPKSGVKSHVLIEFSGHIGLRSCPFALPDVGAEVPACARSLERGEHPAWGARTEAARPAPRCSRSSCGSRAAAVRHTAAVGSVQRGCRRCQHHRASRGPQPRCAVSSLVT